MSDANEGVVYLNEAEGKKRVMNNVKLYIRLLAKFKDDANLAGLNAAAAAQDWETAQTSVHTLKGIAANLSLTELYQQSLEVEAHIKSRALQNESLERLNTCYAATLAEIDKVIAQNA
ncbi:MAG: Hpt domain-containing protein [Treponema sp.]|jgi:HPt (histidine-containing phosphotransfer) domain-containing protein|nr:Hpt domain-containing protein [Treponema sp.]